MDDTNRLSMTADELFCRMDDAGQRGMPFLFAVDFELREGLFTEHPLQQRALLFDVGGLGNAAAVTDSDAAAVQFEAFPEPYEIYARRFDVIRAALMRGDSFLTNLTTATPIRTNISLHEAFSRSRAPYRLLCPGRFVCFSPERFVRIEGRRISTNPMKGTIDATLPDAAEQLLADPKETAEHRTVVDLLRNDLNRIGHRIHVGRYRYLDRIRTHRGELLQMSSEIVGELDEADCRRFGWLMRRLLPAGSVSGAPKEATLHAIGRAESGPRGFYTGVFGYFDGTTMDSGVIIRYIEQLPDGSMLFRSGGGITVNSRCEDEYREMVQKVYLPF